MFDSLMFPFLLGQAKNLNGSLPKKALALVEALEGKVRFSLMDRYLFSLVVNIPAWHVEKVVACFFFVLPSRLLFSCG